MSQSALSRRRHNKDASMYLFAPTYVPAQSGLSQPPMSTMRCFGVNATPVRFGPMAPLTNASIPEPASPPIDAAPAPKLDIVEDGEHAPLLEVPTAPHIDRYDTRR